MGVLFRVDPSAPEPLFAQLASQVRSAAAHGNLAPGDRLPAARDLAASLGVNLHTVLRAYGDLRSEGLIELRRGRGAVMSAAAQDVQRLRTAIVEVAAIAQELNVSPQTTIALLKEALQ